MADTGFLIAYEPGRRAVFLFGFGKNEPENISGDELLTLQTLAATWLEIDEIRIERSLKLSDIEEVHCGQKN